MSKQEQYSAADIYKLWKTEGRQALRNLPNDLVLRCDRIEARIYADVAEFLLNLFGPRNWSWADNEGKTHAKRGLIPATLQLGVEVPFGSTFARRHNGLAKRLQARPEDSAKFGSGKPLYLRMDHLFDLKAGGSVAHISGVLNALRDIEGPIDVLSTDQLTLVEPDQNFHVLTPMYGWGRNLSTMPLLRYNAQVLAYAKAQYKDKPKPKYIYARYSMGSYAALALSREWNVPYICEYNGSNIWIQRNWGTSTLPYEETHLAVEDANLHGADLVVAVSQASGDELRDRGVPLQRILVNPNGVDLDKFGNDAEGLARREMLGIHEDDLVFCFVGTFGTWHGTEVLCKALASAVQRKIDGCERFKLLMVGDGNHKPACAAIVEAAGLEKQVIFTGSVPQSEAASYLSAADVLMSPHIPNPDGTPFFGSPTKLFEYMASKRAIICSDLEQMGDILTHDLTAALVEPNNVDNLADAMASLAADPAYRRAIAKNAYELVADAYTWTKHTKRILQGLGKAVAGE